MQYNYIKRINQIHQQNKTEFYKMQIELHNTDRNHIIQTQQELKQQSLSYHNIIKLKLLTEHVIDDKFITVCGLKYNNCENDKTRQSRLTEWSRGPQTKKVRTVPLMNWLQIKQYLTEGPQSVHVHRCPQGRNTTETRLVLHFLQYTDFRSCAFSFSATSSWCSVSAIRNNTVEFIVFLVLVSSV